MNVKILPKDSAQPVNRQPTNPCQGLTTCNGKAPATPVSGGGGSVCDWQQIANGITYCKPCPAGTKVHYCADIFDAGARCIMPHEYDEATMGPNAPCAASQSQSSGASGSQSGSPAASQSGSAGVEEK